MRVMSKGRKRDASHQRISLVPWHRHCRLLFLLHLQDGRPQILNIHHVASRIRSRLRRVQVLHHLHHMQANGVACTRPRQPSSQIAQARQLSPSFGSTDSPAERRHQEETHRQPPSARTRVRRPGFHVQLRLPSLRPPSAALWGRRPDPRRCSSPLHWCCPRFPHCYCPHRHCPSCCCWQ